MSNTERTIPCLTLWQPWATLMACGAKAVETRSWSTPYRGPVAIHAAKQFRQDERQTCMEEPFCSALVEAGMRKLRDLPLGAVLCVVDLVDVRPTDGHLWAQPGGWPQGREREFGNYATGRFAWVTENVRALPSPIPWTGKQGLWRIPSSVLASGVVTP